MNSLSDKKQILKISNLSKGFDTSKGNISILDDVSFTIYEGEKVAILGPSGSGKTTLLSLIGLLDVPNDGIIEISGQNTKNLTSNEQAVFRNEKIGFIFQSFELISPFTVSENITAPLEIGNKTLNENDVSTLIDQVGLNERKNALPQTLSGGEKQRVAIARALANNPDLILADEPTGSLDRETGRRVISLLLETVAENNRTLIIITHDETITAQMDRIFELKNRTLHERL
jgi:putative ABC transport system ATP-binding protein